MTLKSEVFNIADSTLPTPRLELRWENVESCVFICRYNLVLHIDRYDVRRSDYDVSGSELRILLSTTKLKSLLQNYPWLDDSIDIPYRDGMHAKWDGYQLSLPVFVVYGNTAQRLVVEQPTSQAKRSTQNSEVEEQKTVPPLRAVSFVVDKRFREARELLSSSLSDIDFEIRKVLHKTPASEKSLAHKYLKHLQTIVNKSLHSLRIPTLDPVEWYYDHEGTTDVLPGAHIVCKTCGKPVPSDLTTACDHLLDEIMRAEISQE